MKGVDKKIRKLFSNVDAETKKEVTLYVGEEFYKSYNNRWESMEKRSSKTSWNWATFFLFPAWAVYRKMYAWAYGYLGFTMLMDFIVILGLKKTEWPMSIQIVDTIIWILMAVFANYLYQEKSIKEVEKLKERIPDDEERQAYLRIKGGGSSKSVWLFFAICLAVNMLAFGVLY